MSRDRCATLLSVEVRAQPPDLLLRLAGELDVLSASFLQLPPPRAFDGVRRLVVDLSGVEFCDLAGLRRLAHLDADYAAGGFDVQLVGARPLLRRAALVTGLIPGVCAGDDTARAACSAPPPVIEQPHPRRVQPA